MVLNLKIEQANNDHNLSIPYLDGKGPISHMNLRRMKMNKLRKLFGSQRVEENKMNKYFNDVCKKFKIGRKFKSVDQSKALEILKICTDN